DLNDDVIHLDWDVAVGLNELRTFAKKCIAEPDIVRTAPTMTYPSRYWYAEGSASHPWKEEWMARIQMPVGNRVIQRGEPYANFVGFGLIYLPQWTLKEFTESLRGSGNFRDGNFCEWYYKRTSGQPIPVEWGVNAVHINYSFKNALKGLA
ncbi:MAG: hypothetical protein ACREHG_07005, partial [Candidatus Saccharimonadales bacterium]